jgi:diaminohydroxyphosphoribosylaminopyrimidine deaminase/5-amino-6-(5-phosphoribosylamino)uracil reductase
VVGAGWHHAAGAPHAEVEAIREAGVRARGATAYVTLEPCSHYGRTAPCTEALISAGVARVVFACADCDVRSAGKATGILREAGVEVEGGLLNAEAQRLNEAFFKHKQTGLPFITLKLALTLDGRMATRAGDSQWVTSEESRRRVHLLRDQSDVVMVGAGTLARDNPRLTVRLGEKERRDARQPLPVILAAEGVPAGARVLRGTHPALVFTAETSGRTGVSPVSVGPELYVPPAVEYVPFPAPEGRLDLPAVLAELGRRKLMSVLLEGGATLAGSFLREGLVDKLLIFYAPKLLLDEGAVGPRVPGLIVEKMAEALDFRLDGVEQIGPDAMLTLRGENNRNLESRS